MPLKYGEKSFPYADDFGAETTDGSALASRSESSSGTGRAVLHDAASKSKSTYAENSFIRFILLKNLVIIFGVFKYNRRFLFFGIDKQNNQTQAEYDKDKRPPRAREFGKRDFYNIQ